MSSKYYKDSKDMKYGGDKNFILYKCKELRHFRSECPKHRKEKPNKNGFKGRK